MAPNVVGNCATACSSGSHRVTGDKELLWSRLREAGCLEELVGLVESSGFHPVVLPRCDLLRDGVSVDAVDFGAILGQLGAFGAIIDSRTAAEDSVDIQRELTARELSLVAQHGMSKRSVNQLLRSLHAAKNLGRAACLVIDDCAPPAMSVESVMAPLRESRRLLANGCQLPAVIIGTKHGTVTRVDEDPDRRESQQLTQAQPLVETSEPGLQLTEQTDCFANMMLVAYETAAGAAAGGASGSRASA